MDSRTVLARFDAERQALAMMDHPNIARVYDGGATDANQPFFVMEFVHGVPITDYCDQHRLSVDARLELFVAVCQAVQHAHQKGIIHRDLKPSNVMVTEVDGRPTPKVIDFGVAKATEASLTDHSLGDTGAIVGTPTYMSPEQADPSTQDIDTRTDVYALGVILYELLAGSTPLDATQFKRGALLEMLRMVREVDPVEAEHEGEHGRRPAQHRGQSRRSTRSAIEASSCIGDLDWIVMKALEKDRTRRYETANGLGADVLRHLASEPVLAAPPSRYVSAAEVRKRKHRAGVIAASLVAAGAGGGRGGDDLGPVRGPSLGRGGAAGPARRPGEREEGGGCGRGGTPGQDRCPGQEAAGRGEREEGHRGRRGGEEGEGDGRGRARLCRDEGSSPRRVRKTMKVAWGYDVKLIDAITAALPAIGEGFRSRSR